MRYTVAENEVFMGMGAFCRNLHHTDDRILVLPTEISKVYMDEHSGLLKSPIISALNRELKAAVRQHTAQFHQSLSS